MIALLAILVSLSTVLISLRNAQTNSFIAIQNVMLNGDMQRGRLLIYKAIETVVHGGAYLSKIIGVPGRSTT